MTERFKEHDERGGDGVWFICLVAWKCSLRQPLLGAYCLVASSHFCSLITPSTQDSRPNAGNADFRLQPGPSRVTLRGGRWPARLRGRIIIDVTCVWHTLIFQSMIDDCTRCPITVMVSRKFRHFTSSDLHSWAVTLEVALALGWMVGS
jgi:hypothetical protein